MARQVYFDPFGMRTQGYRAGVQDETGIQNNTRQARYSDAMFPFAVNRAQREDAFETANLPRRNRLADAGLYSAQQPIYMDIARRTGYNAPAIRNDFQFAGAQFGMRPGSTFSDGVNPDGTAFTYTEQEPYMQLPDLYGDYQDFAPNYQNLNEAYQYEAFRPYATEDAAAQLRYDEFGQRAAQEQRLAEQAYWEQRQRAQRAAQTQQLIDMGFRFSPSGQVLSAPPGWASPSAGAAGGDDGYTF